jgi:hypothetical protein
MHQGMTVSHTFLASAETLSITDEPKGTQPLNTAPPPSFFGYSKTLAKVKAPAVRHTMAVLIWSSSEHKTLPSW